MARYLSSHTLACLTRQGAEQLVTRLMSAKTVTVRRVQVNMMAGKMIVEFDTPDREALEAWFTCENFHYDWLMRVELESQDGKLVPVP